MSKARRSKAQRLASLRNLRKAQRSRAASPRRRRRRVREVPPSRAMVLHPTATYVNRPSRGRRGGKRSGRGRGRRVHARSRRRYVYRAGKRYHRPRRYRTSGRYVIGTSRRAYRRGQRRRTRKAYTYSRKGRTIHVRARRQRIRSHRVRPYTRRDGRHVRGHMSYEPYAMENPLSAGEIFVGGLTGVIGFGISSILDRALASHAVKAMMDANNQPIKESNGTPVYSDTPDKGQVYNIFAEQAPMGLARWGAGLGLAAVPLVAAQFVKNPMGRTTLQFFGFGALTRTLGKGLTDGLAWMLRRTSLGQRLYAGEINAHLDAAAQKKAQSGQPIQPAIPAAALTGVGRPALGVGGCSSCGQQHARVEEAPPPPPAFVHEPPAAPPPPAHHAAPPAGTTNPAGAKVTSIFDIGANDTKRRAAR